MSLSSISELRNTRIVCRIFKRVIAIFIGHKVTSNQCVHVGLCRNEREDYNIYRRIVKLYAGWSILFKPKASVMSDK